MITRIKNVILENWMAKVFCLLFALTLWAWVKVQQTAERRLDVQVNFRNLPEDFVVTEKSDRVVSVTLSGPKTRLNSIESSQISVEIDAGQFEPGENSIRILPWNLDVPRGLNIESIQPPRINVILERRITKTVRVNPNVSAPPGDGFEYDVSVTPDTAVIFGATDALEDVNRIDLKAIDLSQHDTGFTRHGVPATLPGGVNLKSPSTNEFSVAFDIYEPIVTRTVSGIKVDVLDVPSDREGLVEPSEIELDVKGPKRTIDRLEPGDVKAEVRAPEDQEPTIRQARIRLPDAVSLAGGQADRRTVRVRTVEK